MHIFYVQGGGLGHLTRTHALIKTLRIPAKDVRIITPSAFTGYFKEYTFIKISWNAATSRWSKVIIDTILSYDNITFCVDTFPFGLRGELQKVYKTIPEINCTYISRILKWQKYLGTLTEKNSIEFSETILLEELYPEHLTWIQQHSKKTTQLTLDYEPVSPTPFLDIPYAMIVHSGGKEDVLHIIHRALEDLQNNSEIPLVVFTQVDISINNSKIIIHQNVYPVSKYYHHAEIIYTAAGFNSIQELREYKDKHIAIPLKKLYDDQFFRNANRF
ncbi:MAG: hypothetical protein CL613_03090 [Aquimarina sp.]|nr:hypothetical protein [Aquimarina sp.]